MASTILPQETFVQQVQRLQCGSGRVVLNIARCRGRWFCELQAQNGCDYRWGMAGRISIPAVFGRAMLEAARREGMVARVHTWGVWTTWHLTAAQEGTGR